MATQNFDKLNNLRYVPYDKYFGDMGISKQRKDARIRLAEQIEEVVIEWFYIVSTASDYFYRSSTFLANELERGIKNAVINEMTILDIETAEHIEQVSKQITDSTLKHLPVNNGTSTTPRTASTSTGSASSNPATTGGSKTEDKKNSDYYTSDDRARFIAENESNSIWNAKEVSEAKADGKKNKTWKTMKDEKVRQDHWLVDGETIPIDELFIVGDSLMAYPKDTTHGASDEEIVNCRCWLEFK